MFREDQPLVPVELARCRPQLRPEKLLLKKLFFQPQRHGCAERAKSVRRTGNVGFEQPLEFEERLVVERDIVDVAKLEAAFRKAVLDRIRGVGAVVLFSRETFFLGRGNNAAVDDESRRAVVVERGNSQDAHHSAAAMLRKSNKRRVKSPNLRSGASTRREGPS